MKHTGHNAEIILVGRNGELILQQRDDKPGITNPGMVTTFGGGVESGESELDAAYRELHEETSLQISKDRFVKYGDYWKTKDVHGEDWKVTFFVVKDVDYDNMEVYEGQGYVVINNKDDMDKYPTSKLFQEVAEDWYSGWRDFLFLPDPPSEVLQKVIKKYSSGMKRIPSVTKPIVYCPVGLVGAGKTSTIISLLEDEHYFIISGDRIRTTIYDKDYNFMNVVDQVIEELADKAVKQRVDILLDFNAGSRQTLVDKLRQQGYGIVVFHIQPSENYILQKLNNLSWNNVPERFTFFKLPRHVLASYNSNKRRMLEVNKHFFADYPPDIVINPEMVDQNLGIKVKELITAKRQHEGSEL